VQQTFVLHSQKNVICTAYSKKQAQKSQKKYCILKKTSFVLRTQKSAKKSRPKKVGKKVAKKQQERQQKSLFLNLSSCCLETGLKPLTQTQT